ncbi:hypothetical protein G7046_g1142 [Stylonectria norvegica]|nr:hypothetical protein G7046_g1142 [Stylonectria norvegica]
MSWELPVLTTLILSVLGFWWVYSPHSRYQKALYALLGGLTLLVNPRRLLEHMSTIAYDAFLEVRLDVLLLNNFNMVLTFSAIAWLLYRSWQTLRKPVPDLIHILGVDVPEAPDVSLAGIRADAATLSWTRPTSNRPVQKYSIQVNGVHVGDSPGNEVAITVTGLKPSHFYNIRVVAVGPNNFQAGSPVVRLRTYAKDGKPELGNSRLPTSFTNHDHPRANGDNGNDDPDAHKSSVPAVEAAPVLDGNTSSNGDLTSTLPGTRRNTINRRHSPSVASMDRPQIKSSVTDGPELSLDELNRKFEGIRKEMDETLAQHAKDETEFQVQEEELKKEKELNRLALKQKEEQTAQLKASVRLTMEQMRNAEKDRAKKEQQLKDKECKKTKVRDQISKLEHEIERMQRGCEGFAAQKLELEQERDSDVQKLDEANAELQEKCTELEAELREKGKQLQDLKAARERLPGGDDEQWKENDLQIRREWEARRKELHNQLVAETKKGHQLDQHIRILGEQLSVQNQSGLGFFNPGDPSAPEFDPSASTQMEGHHEHSDSLGNVNLSSPMTQFAVPEGNFPAANPMARSGFGPGLFMDMSTNDSEHQTEADMRASGGPLSPTAHSLLPSDIFDEMYEGPETNTGFSSFLPQSVTAEEDGSQSPHSSASVLSSPNGSSQNLPFPQYVDGDGQSVNSTASPPAAPPANTHRLPSFLSFQRNKPAKAPDGIGPAIGTLKPGQSQSFPRGTDEHEALGSKRRGSLSFWKNSAGEGAQATPTSTYRPFSGFSTSRLNPFTSSAGALLSERDRENSRPASIASADLPRPSTDSGSIWGAPEHSKNRLWSTNDGRWHSRSGSRRPSLHGSTSALTTTLASADDEILDVDDLLDPQTSPSQVGVIGSRPPGHRSSMSRTLNPAAPTFMGNFFGSKDKGKEAAPEKEKLKGKDTHRLRDKSREGKGKTRELSMPVIEAPHNLDDSPTDSRMSRDTFSVHTQPSISESHESLNLDMTTSNSTTDITSTSHKDPENVVKKLFRKGSSSKFSLSSRLGMESSLFKKGPGSATNSDKNMSAGHRSSIGDLDDLGEDVGQLGRSYDSVTSSPSLGPSTSRGKDSSKEGRMSTWRFSIKKKGKEKESLDMERATDEE